MGKKCDHSCNHTSTDTYIESLRKKGHRITTIRYHLVEILTEASQPLSAQEILDQLSKNGSAPNKTTVYRELDFLIDQKIVEELNLLEGKKDMSSPILMVAINI